MPSTSKILEKFESKDYTPQSWFEEKEAACKKTASEKIGLGEGEFIQKNDKLNKPPPSKSVINANTKEQTKSSLVMREYPGSDKPDDEIYYWARIAGITNGSGCIFDENKNLIGISKFCSATATIGEASESDLAIFTKAIASAEITPQKPVQSTVKKVTPPVKQSSEEEDSSEEEETDIISTKPPASKAKLAAKKQDAQVSTKRIPAKPVSSEEEEEESLEY
jgi:hypothetical protein